MSKKITGQELGMFVGTGLMFQQGYDQHAVKNELHSVHDRGFYLKDGSNYFWDDMGLLVRPIMRPLSAITEEEWKAMGLWLTEWAVFKNAGYQIPGSLRYLTVRALADGHYDIFNWRSATCDGDFGEADGGRVIALPGVPFTTESGHIMTITRTALSPYQFRVKVGEEETFRGVKPACEAYVLDLFHTAIRIA